MCKKRFFQITSFIVITIITYKPILCTANPNLPSGNRPGNTSPIQVAQNNSNTSTISQSYKDFANRNNKEYQKQKLQNNNTTGASEKNTIVVHYKPENMPNFPDEKQDYKLLFDNEFTNIVDNSYVVPDDKDVFISQTQMHKYNEIYKHGNDDDINQIDVIEAEKNTQVDKNDLDEYKIGTHRTRVLAFLTQDQILLSDMFDSQPDGYYIGFVKSKLDENLKYKK